jgi:hypothetical protein
MSQRRVIITSAASVPQHDTGDGRQLTLNERFGQLRGISRRRPGNMSRRMESRGVKKTRGRGPARRARLSALRRIAILSKRGSRRRSIVKGSTRQSQGSRGRGRGGRGRSRGRRQLTKEALDQELEEYMMSTPETAKKYLNEELDEYWAKAGSSSAQTKQEANGPTTDNPPKK